MEHFRLCPICGAKITYKYKSDLTKAIKKNSYCRKCSVSSSKFKKGHLLNELYTTRVNSLDILVNDESLQTFYWVGFIIADGGFHKNSFELGLTKKDKILLETFKTYIKFDKVLEYREKSNSYRVKFSNKVSIDLFKVKFGINTPKTYNPINFTILNSYNTDQILSLLIGIIDGDGHIEKNGSIDANCISITTHFLWEQFYIDLFKFLGIKMSIKPRKSNCIIIRIYLKEYMQQFIQLIDTNNLTHLERKWNIIKNLPLAQEA